MKKKIENVYYETLISKFRIFYKRYFIYGIAESLLFFIFSLIVLITVFSLAESLFYLSSELKTAFFFGSSIISFLILILLIIKNLIFRPDFYKVSKEIEKKYPGLHEKLISAVQLGNLDENELRGQSKEIIDAHVKSVLNEVSVLDIAASVSLAGMKRSAKIFVVSMTLFLLFVFTMPGRFISGVFRFVDYKNTYVRSDKSSIILVNLKNSIVRGENFTVSGFISGEKPHEIKAFYRWEDMSEWNSKPVTINEKNGSFSLLIEKPSKSFQLFIESDDSATEKYRISLIERPEISEIGVSLTYPAYSGQPAITRNDNDGNIRALKGTEAFLKIRATKKIKSMSIVWSDTTVNNCNVTGDTGTIKFTIRKNIDYSISIEDTLGLPNANPITYRITCMEDDYPSITLINPSSDVTLNRSMTIPMAYKASDDYGISSIKLLYRLPYIKNTAEIILPKGTSDKAFEGEYLWNLSNLNLLPEDELSFYVSVYDNDVVNGFKKSVSDTIKVRLPSMTEVLNESVQEQNKGIEKLKEIAKSADRQDKKINDVDKNLMKGRELDWADKKALDDAGNEMRQMQKDAKEISENLKSSAEKLSEQEMAAIETIEQMQKISEIINSIADGEMKEALKQLTAANVQSDPQQVKKAIEKYKINSEDIKKKLDSIIKFLEQLKTVQKFEISKKLLEDMASKQAELSKKYKESTQKESLAREQEKLSAEMKKIEKEADEALKDLQKNFKISSPSLMKSLEDGDVSKNQAKTSESISKSDMSQAEIDFQKSNRMLADYLNKMEILNSSMMSSNTAELKKRLFSALNEMLAVSEIEEKFISESGRKDKDTLVKEQLDAMESFSKAEKSLNSLSEIVIELTGIIGQMNLSTKTAMKNSVDLYTSNNRNAGDKSASESLKNLNSNILILSKMLQKANSSMPGGLPGDMMQQLQDIANGQLSLQQKLGSEQLDRLAAEQQKLSEMLQALSDKMGDDKQLRQMLEKLAGEMDETSKMMSRNEKRELVERRQLDIYRRLLDAKRSRREKDEKDNVRKSWTAKRNISIGADKLEADYGEKEKEINKRIKNLVNDDFDPEYKKMIRLYMESLLQVNGK